MAQLKDLIVNGPSRFIGDVYATTFTGDLNGNASTATSAINAGTISGLSVHSGRNNEANKIVRTDGTGYLQVGYINSSDGHEKNASSPTYVWGSNSSDSYLRSYQTSSLSVNYATTSGSCSGNAATASNADLLDGLDSTAFALVGAHNNLMASGNEFTFASNGFSGDVYLNYRTAGGVNGNITNYILGNGKGGELGIAIHTGNYNYYSPKLDGTGATGTWGINISGNAASATNAGNATSLTAERFDSDDPTPSSKNGLTFQFSYNLGSGASGWWNVLNMRSYSDINYTSSQIITPADNPGTDTGYSGDMKWRQGRNSTWLDWKTLLDSNNYTTYCTPANIGAAPSSHTHNKSQITDFAHTHTKSEITDFAHTHTKSQITDFPTSLPASDVKAWAKADNKPSYTGTEVTLSGYSKNNSYTPIASGDSVQTAIAKLEGAISGLEDLLASI